MPLFSIVIPTFNSSKFINACVDSILKQSFKDFEIIIQDGKSTDNTLDILRDFRDSRIKIYSESDNGVYDAMNKALSKCNGDWLYFLGSDDYLYSDDIFSEINKVISQDSKLNFIYGDVLLRHSNKVYDGVFDRLKLTTRANICHQAIFYKKNLFDLLGDYNLKFKIWADWDFNVRCFSFTKIKTYHLNCIIANYEEANGLSGVSGGDQELEKLLPLFYKEYDVIDNFQKSSIDYKLGNKILNVLRFFRDIFKSKD